jgi:hypothetical protein
VKRISTNLLAEVPREAVDDETLARIDDVSRAARSQSSLLRGLVTGRIWIVFHAGRRPTKHFIRHAEHEEMAALQTAGALQ